MIPSTQFAKQTAPKVRNDKTLAQKLSVPIRTGVKALQHLLVPLRPVVTNPSNDRATNEAEDKLETWLQSQVTGATQERNHMILRT